MLATNNYIHLNKFCFGMIALVIRILVVIFFVGFILFLVKKFTEPFNKKGQCPRCNGQGYWLDARGRERCDVCKGTGKAPNAF